MANVIKLETLSQSEKASLVKEAALCLEKGGVVIFPTETVYGLGADRDNIKAQEKIYKIKGRRPDKPMSWHIGEFAQVEGILKTLPERYQALIRSFLPGPLTCVCPSEAGTIGLRFPDDLFFQSLSKALGRPLVATSANLSNEGSLITVESIPKAILKSVDMVFDGGATVLKNDSTVLDLSGKNPTILRQGVVTQVQIDTFLGAYRES